MSPAKLCLDISLEECGTYPDNCAGCPAAPDDAATLREHAAEMAQALDDLLVWAEWIKAHIHRAPRMNEPNTGARLQASQTLTRWREGPGREKGGG